MNTQTLRLGFSPCPNDTFIFEALINQEVDTEGLRFEYLTEDVETLNQWAKEGRLDLTKLSFHALLSLGSQYGLLETGSALGKGVGPLLIAKKPYSEQELSLWPIAIPGHDTTANLLLSLALPTADQKVALPFHLIEDAIVEETYPFGLIIHENRFTYKQKGLLALMDLGEWWEKETGLPIPLGGIALHRRHPPSLAEKMNRVLGRSIELAWAKYPKISAFVQDHAQSMETKVMRQHIELYVNDFSRNLGKEGKAAIQYLFETAKRNQMIPSSAPSPFF